MATAPASGASFSSFSSSSASSPAWSSLPVFPFPGLPLDLRAKPTGNGTDREWLELREGKAAAVAAAADAEAASASTSTVMVDDGNMLVSLAGSEVHHALFLQSASHAHPLRLLSVRPPFAFPRARPPRASYEGYAPDGCVRAHWVMKHKFLIPSVVLLFVDWADSAPYEAQETAACMRLAKVRGELAHRDTRLLLLVCKTARFASAEDEAALSERLTRGIRRAGVDAAAPHRSVLFFITVDARASVRRLEPAIHELSAEYYKAEVRRLRGLKTRISRSTQALLYVRHQLKAGYFSEAIKDAAAAIKAYSHAYSALTAYVNGLSAAALSSPLAHELKQVGLVLNHRLCRLLLAQSRWADALDQFNAHVASLKRCTGLPDLQFAHFQWLSQQYHLFGDLLEQSAYHASQRSKQLHSGYFYQTAATYALKRKTYAQLVLGRIRQGALQVAGLLQPNALQPAPHLGQARLPYGAAADDARSVAGFSSYVVSSEPADLVRCAVSLEAVVDHSAQVIGLLNKSYERYKREQSERMIVHVASQIAAEYFSSRDWLKAQRFFDRIATMYREEQWWMILTNTLMTSYHCAKELQQHTQTVQYALELLARYATTTTEQKERIHHHLRLVLDAGASAAAVDGPDALPDAALDVPLKYRLIECDAVFLTTPVSVVYVHQRIDLVLTLDYHFPLPVHCTSIALTFSDPAYRLTLIHDGSALPPEDGGADDDGRAHDDAARRAEAAEPLLASADGQVVTRLVFLPNRSLSLHVQLPALSAPSAPLSVVQIESHVLLGPTTRALRLRSWPNRREDEAALQPVFGAPDEPYGGVLSAKEKKVRATARPSHSWPAPPSVRVPRRTARFAH